MQTPIFILTMHDLVPVLCFLGSTVCFSLLFTKSLLYAWILAELSLHNK